MPFAFIPLSPLSPSTPSRTPPTCRLPTTLSKSIPAISYVAYMSHLFLLSPTGPPTPIPSLIEAAQLSLNFAYVTPLAFPTLAPTLHPLLEAIFHLVVAWALLLVPFVSEDLSSTEKPRTAIPATPFLLMTPLLTNIFYLPYLVLRTPPETDLCAVPLSNRSQLQKIADGYILPVVSIVLAAASVVWGVYARPEFGGWTERWASFVGLLHGDILCHSFAVDLLVFALFQGWLVRDDTKRREWEGKGENKGVIWGATLLPFFGLGVYLVDRARRGRVKWVDDSREA